MNYSCEDYPKVIEVQFHNRCNSNCLICPYKDMDYQFEEMDDELFQKLLNEIDENKLVRMIPYLNNEPFLDSSFMEKVKKIRNRFQKLEIEISTNVSLIKKTDVYQIKDLNITELRLSVFGYENETYKKMMPGLNRTKVFQNLEMISNILKESNTLVSIVMIDNQEIDEKEFISMKQLCDKLDFQFERWGFLDRSNNVAYRSNCIDNKTVSFCEQYRPLTRMHILANGDVILCCQDWKHSVVLGNMKDQTIEEIWNSKKYHDIRDSLYNKDRVGPFICQKCKLGH